MKKIIYVLVLIFSFGLLNATEITHYENLYRLANKNYQMQAFDSALNIYLSIAESGLQSSDLLYNIGNCFYKINNTTRAILYYEKALKLAPKDADILYNLNLANKQIVDQIKALPTPVFRQWMTTLTHALPVDHFAKLSIICLFISVIAYLIFMYAQKTTLKRIAFICILMGIVMTVSFYLLAQSQYRENTQNKYAIILLSRVSIYSAPNVTSTMLFILHKGLKVSVIHTQNRWSEIKLSDGNIGWVSNDALVNI